MLELFLHSAPVLLAIASFWSNTERKLLMLNLGLCITITLLLAFQQAWGGVLVMSVAGASTSYRIISGKLLRQRLTLLLIMLMASMIGIVNSMTGKTGWIEILPLFTFIFYRFGELRCKEAGLRLCMISGSLIFTGYAVITHTWGVAITEMLFALSNGYYFYRIKRRALPAAL
ncbi:formyltetrahydrofolate deformylase [Alteromonas pelagimontana]|uniref:Formyltetrahydrofolate deformylase n=1 Tax=Alteromonas pelagimontana TaxID=1858656 RepID=A0A6M4MBP4_9ALTE|nr:YgjV family protein [Alteromonas pelagimontana]QJR80611.1 formyltetrahydrofolate deformylase [Alteromonas pelagimontana]